MSVEPIRPQIKRKHLYICPSPSGLHFGIINCMEGLCNRRRNINGCPRRTGRSGIKSKLSVLTAHAQFAPRIESCSQPYECVFVCWRDKGALQWHLRVCRLRGCFSILFCTRASAYQSLHVYPSRYLHYLALESSCSMSAQNPVQPELPAHLPGQDMGVMRVTNSVSADPANRQLTSAPETVNDD